jgi:hypothetical protein
MEGGKECGGSDEKDDQGSHTGILSLGSSLGKGSLRGLVVGSNTFLWRGVCREWTKGLCMRIDTFPFLQ